MPILRVVPPVPGGAEEIAGAADMTLDGARGVGVELIEETGDGAIETVGVPVLGLCTPHDWSNCIISCMISVMS